MRGGGGGVMRRVLAIAALIFVIDQITKVWIVFGLDLATRGAIDVLPPYLNLRMAWNPGINFGLFAGGEATRIALILIALAIVAWVLVWVRRDPPGRFGQIAAGALVGGALGNVVDRVLYGAVADFLNMSCCGFDNPYAFNVADIAIFAGIAGLVVLPPRRPAEGAEGK